MNINKKYYNQVKLLIKTLIYFFKDGKAEFIIRINSEMINL